VIDAMRRTELFVPGTPVPKGSTRTIPHAVTGQHITRASNASRLDQWVAIIRHEVAPLGLPLNLGPVELDAMFLFLRPKSHRRKDGTLRAGAPIRHTQIPDIDKLLRAVLDALASVVYADDRQVDITTTRRAWSDTRAGMGLVITTDPRHDQPAAEEVPA
jgi:Holliday junction resolvase RusA-like endonuclease